jgi:ABC-type multidrug transport system ATPase subunit
MSYIIEMSNVSYAAQNRLLVSDISCRFEEGKITALIGPSGGGKSTVLKLSAGLFAPDKGKVMFRGMDVHRMSRSENLAFRKESAVVFQDSALWANQSLFQILELPLRVHFPSMSKPERERRVQSVVADVGYRKDLGVRPSQLSMGEQKLIAFARALMCDPRLLYLDEMTESLDERAAQRLNKMVKKLHTDGVTVILVSHDIRVIRYFADIVIIITGGQITQILTRDKITDDDDLSRYIEGD